MRRNHLAFIAVWLPVLVADSLVADFVGSRKSPATLLRLVTSAAALCNSAFHWLDQLAVSGDRLLKEARDYTLSRFAAAVYLIVK